MQGDAWRATMTRYSTLLVTIAPRTMHVLSQKSRLAFQMIWTLVKGVDVGNYDTTPITSYYGGQEIATIHYSDKGESIYGKSIIDTLTKVVQHTFSFPPVHLLGARELIVREAAIQIFFPSSLFIGGK